MAEFRLLENQVVPYQWSFLLEEWADRLEALREVRFVRSRKHLRVAKLLYRGSIRGIRLEERDDEMRVVLQDLASRQEWTTAGHILRWALENGGGRVVDSRGRAIELEELSPRALESRGRLAFLRSARRLAAREGPDELVRLRLVDFSLCIERRDLYLEDESGVDELEAALSERVGRHAGALTAPALPLDSGGFETIWSLVPTLVPSRATRVLVDAARRSVVQSDELRRVLGDRVEPADPFWYLPALDPVEDLELIEALHAASLPANDGAEPGVEETIEEAENEFAAMTCDVRRSLDEGSPIDQAHADLVQDGVPEGLASILIDVLVRASRALSRGDSAESIFEAEQRRGIPRPVVRGVLKGLEAARGPIS